MRLTLQAAAILAATAVAAPTASAADTTIAADPLAQRLTALDGTVVWVSGRFPNQTLMQHTAAGTAPVKGAPRRSYPSIDLGRDGRNRLRLTYLRCAGTRGCTAISDDLQGRRTVLRGLAPSRCTLTTAPSLWRTRTAIGVACTKRMGSRRVDDPERSGVYVKSSTGSPRRLALPADAVKFGVDEVTWVDLRGTQVAAVVADIYEYVFAQTVTGGSRRSFLAAASEGESDEHVRGLSVGSAGVVWALVNSEHTGDPNQAIIRRLTGDCLDSERLRNATETEEGFKAVGLAVDRRTVHLAVPGSGIVTHPFAPEAACIPL